MPKPEADSHIDISAPDAVSYGHLKVRPSEKRKRVQSHFDVIARRYDLAYVLLSFGLYRWWRRSCLEALKLSAGDRLLDLCGGTGDLSRMAACRRSAHSVVCDLNRAMMQAGRRKMSGVNHLQWVHGNAEWLPFSEGAFDSVFVGLGLRNLAYVEKGLEEIFRVLNPGGRLVILEFSIPFAPTMKTIYLTYSFKIMPALGGLVTGAQAPFRYLAESVHDFPKPEYVGDTLHKTGFTDVAFKPLSKGLVTLYTARKPGFD